jgi:hypothetical protein
MPLLDRVPRVGDAIEQRHQLGGRAAEAVHGDDAGGPAGGEELAVAPAEHLLLEERAPAVAKDHAV